MAKFRRKRYKHSEANRDRLEKTFKKLRERWPEYANLLDTEAGRDALGNFLDFLDEKYRGLSYNSDEAFDMLSTARFKVDMELIANNYDLFSRNYNLQDEDSEKLIDLRQTADAIRTAEKAAAQGKYYKGGYWRDKRGRFTARPRL